MKSLIITFVKFIVLIASTSLLGSCALFELGDGGCHSCSMDGENWEEFCDSNYADDDAYKDAIKAMEDDGYTCEE